MRRQAAPYSNHITKCQQFICSAQKRLEMTSCDLGSTTCMSSCPGVAKLYRVVARLLLSCSGWLFAPCSVVARLTGQKGKERTRIFPSIQLLQSSVSHRIDCTIILFVFKSLNGLDFCLYAQFIEIPQIFRSEVVDHSQ